MGNAFRAAHIAQKSAPITFNTRIAEKLQDQQLIYDEVVARAEREKEKVEMNHWERDSLFSISYLIPIQIQQLLYLRTCLQKVSNLPLP